ncbi:hypothetical protein, partial [Anaerorhabdus sp.]|uniref:NAD(P)/FAD-dependent oxidoreductase n=1 Tax=Anaerorhabdus sp. TaxID=1872524 RepID=UPI002B203B59
GPLNEGATKASVGCCVSEGLLRAHNMSIDQYFNYWLEHSQIAKKYLSNAHCVDGMKGWRLPNAPQILKNYGPGCMVIGDAASCPDPCYYYGVSPAMYGGKICAEVAEKAFKENDFSEELLSEFHVKLGEMFNPAWKQYVTIRETIIGNREVYRDLLRFAKEKPEYPNIDFGATFGEYMKLVLKKNEGKFEFGNHLAGHEQ